MTVTKLGILVVYFVDDSEGAVLQLHLDAFRRLTESNHTIYAAANRLSLKFVEILKNAPNVKVCTLPGTELRMSREHAYYLDQLADVAIRDGCSHLCTFDVDSFPIRKSWDLALASNLTHEKPVAAVLRKENGDSVLAHPCCTFFGSPFWIKYKPRFLPSWQECDKLSCKWFLLRHLSEGDTGIGISYTLQKHGLGWHKMLRSNANNDHYLIGGIYDDLIFHLGASTRGKKQFRGDLQFVTMPLFTRLRLAIGRYLPTWLFRRAIVNGAMFQRDHLLGPIQRDNQQAFERVRNRLIEYGDRYFDYLLGENNQLDEPRKPTDR